MAMGTASAGAAMTPKVNAAMAKALATHLGGKPMTRKTTMPSMKQPKPSLTPTMPGMDPEDMLDGGADEATEKA
jgi:hypothetical protein